MLVCRLSAIVNYVQGGQRESLTDKFHQYLEQFVRAFHFYSKLITGHSTCTVLS